jgi:hypothetical protein
MEALRRKLSVQKAKLHNERTVTAELARKLEAAEMQVTALTEENKKLEQQLKGSQIEPSLVQRDSARVANEMHDFVPAENDGRRSEEGKQSNSVSSGKEHNAADDVHHPQELERLRIEVERLQQELGESSNTDSLRAATKKLHELSAGFISILDSIESKIAVGIDTLWVQIETLEVSLTRLSHKTTAQGIGGNSGLDPAELLAQIIGGIKSIERLSRAYATGTPTCVEPGD